MTSHTRTQLALQMADDLRRDSLRLRSSPRSRLSDLCEIWIEAYEGSNTRLGTMNVMPMKGGDTYSKIVADRIVREAMPLWLWFAIGQILLKLIWQWWQNREKESAFTNELSKHFDMSRPRTSPTDKE